MHLFTKQHVSCKYLLSHSILVTVLNIIVLSVPKLNYFCQSNITETRGQASSSASNQRLSSLPRFDPTHVKKLRACPNMTLAGVQDDITFVIFLKMI